MDKLIKKASEIIFSNEGNYGSVNKDDNGAVSIGKVQWHGERARKLLKTIIECDVIQAQSILTVKLFKEIIENKTWNKRTVTELESMILEYFLKTKHGKSEQDKLADKDISGYIRHIQSLGVKDDNSIILLADIENQGGASASTRIIKNTKVTTADPLDSYMGVALEDKVFKTRRARRLRVYKQLTGRNYDTEIKVAIPSTGYTTYIVKRGDYLSSIGAKYNVKWQKIAEDNNIKSPYTIYPNQILKIKR